MWLVGFVVCVFITLGFVYTDRDTFERGLAGPVIVSIVGSAIWPLIILAGAIGGLSEMRRRAKPLPPPIANAAGLESVHALAKPWTSTFAEASRPMLQGNPTASA